MSTVTNSGMKRQSGSNYASDIALQFSSVELMRSFIKPTESELAASNTTTMVASSVSNRALLVHSMMYGVNLYSELNRLRK